MSKFSLGVLQRCVFPFVSSDDPDVILGATFGEDVALTRVGGNILVSHLDPIVGAINNIGWLAVHVACNDIATTGCDTGRSPGNAAGVRLSWGRGH